MKPFRQEACVDSRIISAGELLFIKLSAIFIRRECAGKVALLEPRSADSDIKRAHIAVIATIQRVFFLPLKDNRHRSLQVAESLYGFADS
ncbi:MAG TPA: hypothetical protein VEQ40_11175 [Pyrinomonadaceae bacterium]|nr:hypothetical protein [Pyrinomonadaceae bacterium]